MDSLQLTQLRGELEGVGNVLSLLVDLSGSGIALSERSHAGLVDLGASALARLDEAIGVLRHYDEAAS